MVPHLIDSAGPSSNAAGSLAHARAQFKASEPIVCSSENQFAVNPAVVLGYHFDRESGPDSRLEAPDIGGKMLREDDRIGRQREFSAYAIFDFELVS
jgi:hypothetical protein